MDKTSNLEKLTNLVSKRIKLEKNLPSSREALTMARKYLKDKGCDPLITEGFVYIEGPTVSDLMIVSPATTGTFPLVRSCNDKEWNDYYRTFLI